MTFSWFLIGILSGSVLGLAGAGGAIVSVPLFIHINQYTIKEATLFSLYAVLVGAMMNWFFHRKDTFYSIAIPVALFSTLGSTFFSGLKQSSPIWLTETLFVAFCMLSLFSFWYKKFSKSKTTSNEFKFNFNFKNILNLIITGILLGAIMTLTGLGGGVVLIPFMKGWLKISSQKAVTTTLFTICLAAPFSIFIQRNSETTPVLISHLAVLIFGSFLAAYILKKIIATYHDKNWLLQTRDWLFSIVVVISIVSIFFK